jgi:hypothetical protein
VAGASGLAGDERKWCDWGQRRSWEHEVPAWLGVGGTSGRCRRWRRANPFRERVAEPPKIIPYYRLNLSTWPLSNNKELFCRHCWVKPGKSLTTGSRYALSPHEGGTRVHHYIT